MASLTFDKFSFCEQKPRPVTFEDVFQRYGSLAEIHQYHFDDQYGIGQQAQFNTPLTQQNGWIGLTGGTRDHAWFANADNLPQSYVIEQYVNAMDVDTPIRFDVSVAVQSFTGNQADQGIRAKLLFFQNATSPLGAGYETGYISDAEVEIVAFGSTFPVGGGASYITTKNIPALELPSHGIVRCMFYQSQYDLNNLTEISVVLWYNDICLGYCIAAGIPQTYIGNKMQWNQIEFNTGLARIGKLSEICPVSSADPGEAFDGAIQRAIQDRYIKYFSRGDGSLKVTIPAVKYINNLQRAPSDDGITTQYVIQNTNVKDWMLDNAHYLDRMKYISKGYVASDATDGSWYEYEFGNQLSIDYSQAVSHVRMLGAFAWATAIDWWLVDAVGNRFTEIQNSAVFSAAATKEQADKFLRRVREQIFRMQIQANGFIFSEPEDLVLHPGVNSLTANQVGGGVLNNAALWWIDSINWETIDGDSLKCTINLRLNGFIDFKE